MWLCVCVCVCMVCKREGSGYVCIMGVRVMYDCTSVRISVTQSWALSVFFNFLKIKNDFLHFLSSYFDWEWAF